jgi:GNAT superfamily N-acetyltransferase
VVREAKAGDLESIARLHVETFIETHGAHNAPTLELRRTQWSSFLDEASSDRFCVLAESSSELLGFARSVPHRHETHGEYEALLDKIYVLRAFHRQGIGTCLMRAVAEHEMAMGRMSMLLFGDAESPSNGFYERLGGRRLLNKQGEFHGGYGWEDLSRLVA